MINEYKFENRSFISKILEHKYLISFVILLSLLITILYLTVTDKIYRSDMTIEITPKETLFEKTKINPIQNSDYERYFETQMDFLKSRYLISKVISELNSNIKFFTKGSFDTYKSIKDEPPIVIKKFKIKDNTFYQRYFEIKILNDKQYSLALVRNRLINKTSTKPIICNFGDEIITNFMDFKIIKSKFTKYNKIYIKILPLYKKVNNVIKSVKVTKSSDKSSFIKISYDDTSPKNAKDFLEKLIDIYKGIVEKSQKNDAKNYSQVIESEIKKVKEKLDENEKKLLKFSEENQISGIKKQTDNIVDTMYKDEERLKELDTKYQTLRTILVMVKDVNNYKNILSLLGDIDNKNLAILINAILEEEKIYQKEREKYKDLHPKMVELKRSITVRKIALKKNLIELFKSLKKQKIELENSIKKQKDDLNHLPSKEIGFAQLKREHTQLEKNYLALLDKKSKLKLSQKIDQDYILRVVDAPYIPTYHIKPKGIILLLLGLIVGAIFGVLLALLKDYFKKRVVVPSDIDENSFIPLLGSVSLLKNKELSNSLFIIKEPNNQASIMMWEIRNSIEKYKTRDKGMVISISSMIRGEGKTTISANLATALSQGDSSVIVVSLDLRLPAIHRMFDIKNRYGITSVMFDKVDINNVIKRVNGFENLYLLPSGVLPNNPMKVINSKFMDKLFDELRKTFDYIVIDLAPLSVAPESIFILKKSDLNISVLKSNYSEKKFILFTEDIVKKNGIKNFVFLLNGLHNRYIKTISRKENNQYLKEKEIADLTF